MFPREENEQSSGIEFTWNIAPSEKAPSERSPPIDVPPNACSTNRVPTEFRPEPLGKRNVQIESSGWMPHAALHPRKAPQLSPLTERHLQYYIIKGNVAAVVLWITMIGHVDNAI